MPAGKLVAAGGFLLQAVPGHDTAILEQLVERTEDLPPIERMLAEGDTPAGVLAEIFGDVTYDSIGDTADLISLHMQP